MQVTRLAIEDVALLVPRRFQDARGFFVETWNERAFRQLVADVTFVQDNHSLSVDAGTVRGLHFQRAPHAQGKLVRVVRGAVFDVAVDIRVGSPTYGRHVSTTLTASGGEQLWIPAGFAHGFCTLEPNTEFLYKVTDYYSAAADSGCLWNDPDIGIDWPVEAAAAILSEKDAKLAKLGDIPPAFTYESKT
jgi:dTDP-4-dehydrorhamnose 3,5-epimerase